VGTRGVESDAAEGSVVFNITLGLDETILIDKSPKPLRCEGVKSKVLWSRMDV
jgi:hypothetical protein